MKLFLFPASILLILLAWAAATSSTSWNRLDRDTAADCADRVETCGSSEVTYLECPNTCAQALGGDVATERAGRTPRDNEDFYHLEATSVTGKTIDFDRFERYVTIVAVIPLQLQSMAQYYYDLTEHFAEEHPYSVSTMILPFITTSEEEEAATLQTKFDFLRPDETTTSTATANKRRFSIVLKTHVAAESSLNTHSVVKYIESTAHSKHEPLHTDRATLFLVSHDGHSFEKRVCPSMKQMKKLLERYLELLEHDQEL